MSTLQAAGELVGSALLVALLVAGIVIYTRSALRMRREGSDRVRIDDIAYGEVLLALAFIGWFLMFTFAEFLASRSQPQEVSGPIDPNALLFGIMISFGLLAILLGVLRARGHSLIEFFGLRQYPLRKVVPASIGWLLLAYPVVGLSMAVVVLLMGEPPAPQQVLQVFLLTPDPMSRALLAFMAVFVAPVFEEIVFRGFLYPVFKRYAGAVLAAVMASILFSIVHVYLPAILAFFVLAICLTIAYERTGSIVVPIVMHMIFNAVTLIVALVAPDGMMPGS